MNRLSREAQERLDAVYDALRLEVAGGHKAEKTLGMARRESADTSIERAA